MGDNNNEEVLVPTTKKAGAKPKAAAAGSATKKSRNPYTAAERKEAAEQVLAVKLAGKKILGKHVTELSRAIGTSRNEATLRKIINSMEKRNATKAEKEAAKPVKAVKAASASKKAAPAAAPRVSAAASLLAPASIIPSKKDLTALTAAIGTAKEEEVLNAIVTAAAPNKKGTKKANREAAKAEFERFKREAHADLMAASGQEPAVSNVERLAAIRMSGSTLSVADYMIVKKHAATRKGRKGAKASLAAAEFHPVAMDACDQCRMKLMLMNDPAERRAAIRKLREGMAKNDMLEGRKFVYNNGAVLRRESNRENRSASRKERLRAIKAAAGRVSQSPLRPYRGTRKAFRFQTEGTGY
jgi:ribosomal protein L12E/L44/L45/RPP1/RPP2